MEKLLFIDACISTHASRTKRLCTTYIDQFLKKNPEVTLDRGAAKGKSGTADQGTDY